MKDRNCLTCGERIPWSTKIDNKTVELNSRKYCLKCVPYKSKYEQAKYLIYKNGGTLICQTCGKEYSYQRRKNTSKFCNWCRIKPYREIKKDKLLEYKGGKCVICGYSRCSAALDFHHLNPEEKDFNLSGNASSKSLEILKKEVDKCVILCATCHREVENGFTVIP